MKKTEHAKQVSDGHLHRCRRGMAQRALHYRDGRHMSAFCRRLPGYIWWWPAALGLLVPACALPDTATSRSIDTVIAERRAALIDSLKSGGWLVQADMENASLVGMSRARSLRRKPFTNADLRTINYDGGPLLTGHDLLAVFADLIAGASGAGPLNYMEIGVAQGRNIFGALQVFGPTWHATAFSFERINPPLEAKLRASSAAPGADRGGGRGSRASSRAGGGDGRPDRDEFGVSRVCERTDTSDWANGRISHLCGARGPRPGRGAVEGGEISEKVAAV